MTGFATTTSYAGAQPMSAIWIPDTRQQHPLGTILDAYDTSPYFGGGRFMYLKAPAALGQGRLVTPDVSFYAQDVPNTANTGVPVMAAAATFTAIDQFGWFQFEGALVPVQTAASVAAGVAVGVGAAGKAGTNTAGKQILGMRVQAASTLAITKANAQTYNGSKKIMVSNIAGVFLGQAVTGTGIGASAVVTSIDPSGNQIGVDVASTATGAVTITLTNTNFLLVSMFNAFVQGAIT